MNLCIDFSKETGNLRHFWESTGFSPARLLLNSAMRQTITYISSIPYGGITYIRIHYLLELIKVRDMDTISPRYDWMELDEALDLLIHNRLKPFFELMGNPSGYFTDFLIGAQVDAWRRLVRDLASHCLERYGKEEVSGWYFETWNEPDGPDKDWYNHDIQAFLNYYDACSEGLKDADDSLRFGGPGSCVTLSNEFRSLLEHCDRGINYYTGEKGVRMDFISVHEKGAIPCLEDLNPDTRGISSREGKIIEYIRKEHPGLSMKPFMNNECDPQIGWSDFHTWHARPYYAAIVCKIINQHLTGIIDKTGCDYELLSNDNGFMGRWGNRSLLACFGEKLDLAYDNREFIRRPDRIEEILKKQEFSFIKKPVFNAMVMLSLLGNKRCEIVYRDNPPGDIGAIAAKYDEDQVSVLIYNSRDKIMSGGNERIELHLEGLSSGEAALVHYRIDEEHGDPYGIWEKNGAPVLPKEEVLEIMKENQEFIMYDEVRNITIEDGRLDMSFDLPLTGVSLILVCRKLGTAPCRVENIKVDKYKGLVGKVETMLSWKSIDSRFIRTYEILFCDRPDGIFSRVNKQDLICSAYLHSRDKNIKKGYYKVKAIDYWGCAGEESEIIEAEGA